MLRDQKWIPTVPKAECFDLQVDAGREGAVSPVESCLRQDSFAVFNRASRMIRESEDLPE